jgi:hypothetical protein
MVCQYVVCFIFIAILNYIKSRRLDTLFEFEEKVMSKAATLDRNIMDLLTDSDAGNPDDKMRLFIIFYICSHSMSNVRTICFIIQCVQVSRKLGDSVERTQHSSQITAAAADSGVSHGTDTRASSVGLTLLLQ